MPSNDNFNLTSQHTGNLPFDFSFNLPTPAIFRCQALADGAQCEEFFGHTCDHQFKYPGTPVTGIGPAILHGPQKATVDNGTIRQFATGATRDTGTNKLEFGGFLHPLVLERYAEYMHSNRKQSDGTLRASDNWTKGLPKDVCYHSAFRHFVDFWKEVKGTKTSAGIEVAICAVMFNLMAYLLTLLQERNYTGETK